ncbi:MAG: cytochrome c biogenesis protein DipZ [Anaerolineae bacterium]|nr:cytochrome c biogenesis protein DipZ [Anaerolineae bacterium]
MLLLLVVAFVAGIVTVLSPCILPVLPIVLGSSVNGGKSRPFGVVTGLIVSFSIFTLAATQIVTLLHLPASSLRLAAIVIILLLGLSLVIPAFNQWFERLLSRLPRLASTQKRSGFWGGILTGASLGLIWAPCAGPILAAVTTLAATQQVSAGTVGVIVAYAFGSGIPMLGIAYGGRALAQRSRSLVRYGGRVQQVFGGLMIATAILMVFNLDVAFTVWATTSLAPSWTNTLQSIEQNDAVKTQLDVLQGHDNAASLPQAVSAVNESGPAAPEFVGISNWINTEPLTMAGLHGKVVLIDFWTYSCINCIRTLPYTTAWYNKYKDQGLVVIGVHSPEFAFEHETSNVEDAVKRFNIAYPVAQDNDFKTWQAFNNEYWPAEYLIDAKGVIRHTHFGEGEYDETEQTIQQLLKEAGAAVTDTTLTKAPVAGYSTNETPETYVGTDRQTDFASPQKVMEGIVSNYSIPDTLPLNDFGVSGGWTFGPEYATTARNDAKLKLHFYGKDVYLVMTSNKPVPVNVNLVSPSQKNQSDDVNSNGQTIVGDSRLYHLVQLDSAKEGTVELQFTQPGVRVYAFTFGS